MSGLAACGACLFTNPLEVVKTRMQLQGELQAPGTYQRHYRNVFHAFITIGRVDGLAALQKGLGPALLYQFLMNGIRLGTYGLAEAGGYLHSDDGSLSPARSAAAGALAGVMGAYLGSPIYMVKTHLQAQAASEIAVGHQYKHQVRVCLLHWSPYPFCPISPQLSACIQQLQPSHGSAQPINSASLFPWSPRRHSFPHVPQFLLLLIFLSHFPELLMSSHPALILGW